MRFRAASAPEFTYPYLSDVAAARMAEAIIRATAKAPTRRRYEARLRIHLVSMHEKWPRTLKRRPVWDGTAISDLPFDSATDARTRYQLLVDAAFVSPLDTDRSALSSAQRLTGLRALASWLSIDQVWGDRVLEVRDSAFSAHRESTRPSGRQGLTKLLAGATGGDDTAAGTWLLGRVHHADHKLIIEQAQKLWAGHAGTSPLVGLGPDTAVAKLVRLQMHIALIDGWAFVDVAAVSRTIDDLAGRRAELQELESQDPALSETERSNAAALAKTVDRALNWLYKEHSRAAERAALE